MKRLKQAVFLIFFLCPLFFFSPVARAETVSLRSEDAAWIAGMIFQNECQQSIQRLTTWNEGEDFPSLGIGHFIWYPQGRRGPFRESFPELVDYLKSTGRAVPDWLEETLRAGMPWKTREEFLADQQGEAMIGLRQFLSETMDAQAIFMIRRFQKSLLQMIEILPVEERASFLEKVFELTKTRNGLYAMIDYANFKGDGLSEAERYHTHGWGLFQVMREMRWPAESSGIEKEFVEAARKVLRRRVDNAPAERLEDRWIEGWMNRVTTYSTAAEPLMTNPRTDSPIVLPETIGTIEILNRAEFAV